MLRGGGLCTWNTSRIFLKPGALEPELNELPDSGENEITEPRNTGDFEESVTSPFHRKPRALDSTRLWKLRCSFALESELGNLSGTPNSMFLWYSQLEFFHTSFQPICGDLQLASTVDQNIQPVPTALWVSQPHLQDDNLEHLKVADTGTMSIITDAFGDQCLALVRRQGSCTDHGPQQQHLLLRAPN